jgi:CubicO group peptidase (beta-lactamase class C family)
VVPAANGHFTARALAHMYAALGRTALGRPAGGADSGGGTPLPLPELVPPDRMADALQPAGPLHELPPGGGLGGLLGGGAAPGGGGSGGGGGEGGGAGGSLLEAQGAAALGGGGAAGPPAGRMRYGLGWQLYGECVEGGVMVPVRAFGHSGLSGSVAFYHPAGDVAVAVLVSQMSVSSGATRALLRAVGDALGDARLGALPV